MAPAATTTPKRGASARAMRLRHRTGARRAPPARYDKPAAHSGWMPRLSAAFAAVFTTPKRTAAPSANATPSARSLRGRRLGVISRRLGAQLDPGDGGDGDGQAREDQTHKRVELAKERPLAGDGRAHEHEE